MERRKERRSPLPKRWAFGRRGGYGRPVAAQEEPPSQPTCVGAPAERDCVGSVATEAVAAPILTRFLVVIAKLATLR